MIERARAVALAGGVGGVFFQSQQWAEAAIEVSGFLVGPRGFGVPPVAGGEAEAASRRTGTDGYTGTLPLGRRKQSKPGYPFHFTCPHLSQSDPYFYRGKDNASRCKCGNTRPDHGFVFSLPTAFISGMSSVIFDNLKFIS
jgi:hypothetical protein